MIVSLVHSLVLHLSDSVLYLCRRHRIKPQLTKKNEMESASARNV